MNFIRKRKTLLLIVIMAAISLLSVTITKAFNRNNNNENSTLNIVTSFYPMYIATANIVEGMDHVKLVNLMEKQGGCLHDYQLTTSDMRKLEDADVFIMNGAGMEGYVEEIIKAYPDLTIIDTSKGTTLLDYDGEEHSHEDEEEDDNHEENHSHEEDEPEDEHTHDHGDYNAHMWLDCDNYVIQIQNIANGLAAIDKENGEDYVNHQNEYVAKVQEIKKAFEQLGTPKQTDVITFHNSFDYLAKKLGIHVAYSVEIENESSLNAGQIATVIDYVKKNDVHVLFTEKQYEATIANQIATETGAKVYVLDSLVTGDGNLNSYIDGMMENLEVIKGTLY